MATIGRKGDFGYLNDNLLRLQKEKDWLFITEDTSLINKYHFKKYDYYYGLVIKNTKIISAYSIYYYALYKELKFFVENVIKNDIFILKLFKLFQRSKSSQKLVILCLKKKHQNSGTLGKDTINKWIISFLSVKKKIQL